MGIVSVIDDYDTVSANLFDLIILKSLQMLYGDNNWKEIMKHFPFHKKNKLVTAMKNFNHSLSKPLLTPNIVLPSLNCENFDSFCQYVKLL